LRRSSPSCVTLCWSSIDPLTAYLGETDSHKAADVRAVLTPLGEVAARRGAAIVAVSHLRKSGAGEAMLQVTGSLAFVAAARAAYIVAKDQSDPARRLMLPVKNNLGDDQTGYAFKIEMVRLPSGIETPRVAWEAERVMVTADEALATPQAVEERSAVEDAIEFLRGVLADGPVPARQVRADAEGAGHSWAAVRRAQKVLGVGVVKAGMRSGWEWTLTPKMLKTPEDAQREQLNTFGNVEHLRQPAGPSAGASEPDSEVF
jgi:putative DNA primase/helicase